MLPDVQELKMGNNNGFGNENRKQPVDRARRKALKIIVAGTAVAGALAIPSRWSKPVVNSIILPAHAQATNAQGPATETTTTAVPTTNSPLGEGGSATSWGGAVFTAQAPLTVPTEVAPGSQRSAVQGKKRKK